MRFVILFFGLIVATGLGIAFVHWLLQSISNHFFEKSEIREAKIKAKAEKLRAPKKDRIRSNFEIFVETYLKMKTTSSENLRLLQFIARDVMKSQEYQQESLKYNVITIIYLVLILVGSLMISLIANYTASEYYFVTNMIICIVDFFLFCMIGQRMSVKKFKVFESVPLTEAQAEKLTKLQVEGNARDYIIEKSNQKHGLNGADLIFLTSIV